MNEGKKFFVIVVILALLGYMGAAIFYWRWRGIPEVIQHYACPFCPYIDGLGTGLQKFLSRTFAVGTLQAAVLIVIFVFLFVIPRAARRLWKPKHN